MAGAGAVIAMLGLFAQSAFAASPHFISADANLTSSGNLEVQFKEAGLGDSQNVTEVASADATAEYACINNGGKHPQATNKETVSGPVTASGSFSSGKNGQITGSLTLSPPSQGSFSCPAGQNLILASVSYTNVSITDTNNSVSTSINGTFSKTFFSL